MNYDEMLVFAGSGSRKLTARIGDRELLLSDADQNSAIAAVHQLLHEENILFDTQGAGL